MLSARGWRGGRHWTFGRGSGRGLREGIGMMCWMRTSLEDCGIIGIEND